MRLYSGYKAFRNWLQEPIRPHVLAIFRILFGLFMAFEMVYYFRIDLVRNMFVLPALNFKYDFLYWLKPLPEMGMYLLLGFLLLCSLAIASGLLFKWASRLFALGYAYIFLLDKSIYNNHIYLFILLAILFSFTDADKLYSLRPGKDTVRWIPRWQTFILQLQIMIVYFYGGLAKVTYDWIVHCEPVRSLLTFLKDDHFLAPVLKNEGGVYLFSYGGLLLDLLAPVLLWYKPVRKWAIYPFILFHLVNSTIFSDIGIFPFVMLFALLLFYDVKEIPGLKNWVKAEKVSSKGKKDFIGVPAGHAGSLYSNLLVFYFVFQLLFPLRGHFLPNDLDWTTIGNRFSWRMKVDTRQIEEIRFVVKDPETQQTYPMDIRTLVNDMQILNLSMDPRSVKDFGNHLAGIAFKNGVRTPEVYSSIKVRYNGRPHLDFIRPDADLTRMKYRFYQEAQWVVPLQVDGR